VAAASILVLASSAAKVGAEKAAKATMAAEARRILRIWLNHSCGICEVASGCHLFGVNQLKGSNEIITKLLSVAFFQFINNFIYFDV
jgi:hypothetical protein